MSQTFYVPPVLYTKDATPKMRRERQKLAEKMARKASKLRWLYAIGCGEFVKFGIALDMKKRMANYDCHNPFPVVVIGSLLAPADLEKRIHAVLKRDWHKGEWFKASDDVLEVAAAIKSGNVKTIHATLEQLLLS